MGLFHAIAIFWLGALTGSFLNVVGLRLLREESIVFPGSHCYACNTPIRPYDNIPILSWLLLRGRCRHCHAAISLQYPAVELLTALLFVTTVWQFGFTLLSGFLLFLWANFIVILITDFREQYIYDINSLGLIPVGLVFAALNMIQVPGERVISLGATMIHLPEALVSSLMAVGGAFVIFFVLNALSKLLLGKPGFGEGDTRLLMGIGAFFGVKLMVLTFVLSFALQAAVGLPLLVKQWLDQKAYQPVRLFLGAMAIVLLPYGAQLLGVESLIVLPLALGCGVVAMILAFKALKSAASLPTGLTYLPFGPAIVFAAMGLVFFKTPIFGWLEAYLSGG